MKKTGIAAVLVFIVAMVVAIPLLVFAADGGTITNTVTWIPGQPVKIVKVTWTSTADGWAFASIGEEFNGKVFLVKTVPSATAGLVPDDNYDVYLKEYTSAYSYLSTTVENRDTANTEMVAPSNVPIYGNVGFSVSGAGDVTSGQTWFYVEVPK